MSVLQEIKTSINNWWIYLVLGILLLLGSFYVFSVPEGSYITLSMFFAAFILVDGISTIALSISNRNTLEGWGWQLASGIISTLIGIGLFNHPGLTMTILPVFVGFWVVMKGSMIIGLSMDLKSYKTPNWGWVLILGILNTLLGMLMIFNPVFGASMILIFTAISMFTMGFTMIIVSFRLRRFKKKIEIIKDTSKDKLEEVKLSIENYIKEKPDDLQGVLKTLKEKLDKA
jgi:uncharacterized membrane protein HdeD (DUF308 family)